jgi:ATP-dependent Clp protease ATP-binding subunit ClpB
VGYDEGGQLTEQVRRRPYAVLLFDEIEKAHPEVFNVFLQILDEGRLTDGQGRTVDFKNAVIIMTSNIGSHFLHEEGAKLKPQEIKTRIQQMLLEHFRPEFLNRLDEVVVFSPLGKEELVKIVGLQLENLRKLLAGRKIKLNVTPAAEDLLLREGYDPQYGARPLKRTIQRSLQDPLAMKILAGEILPGASVEADADPKTGEMQFRTVEPAARLGRMRHAV